MDAFEAIKTKLEVRQYEDRAVPADIRKKILESARLTGSSGNTQHWRFILLQEKSSLSRLAGDSMTGKWISGADFAVVIFTNPKVPGHLIDAGRALQDMELTAWDNGIGSGIFTGINGDQLRKNLGVPDDLQFAAALGFGYPKTKISGKKKKRKSLAEIFFVEKFGNKFEEKSLK
jgi:nitroreductase